MDRYSRIILITAPLFVIWFSWWQGSYNLDPHHWGLMLSNAKDLYGGQVPYKEIFIQYGILTTIFQAVAYGIGKNMLSIIVITGVFYALGLLILYAIALQILKNKTAALYVFVLAVLFHPLSMYPWSNYITFPFLMLGLYGLLRYRDAENFSLRYCFFAGLSLGLAVLAREGLAPAIVLLIPGAFAVDAWCGLNWKKSLQYCMVCVIGSLIPISIFFGYLYLHGLLDYWIKLSIELPAIYVNENFSYIKVFIFKALFKAIYEAYRHAEVRWILTSFFLIASIWALLMCLRHRRQVATNFANANVAKAALASLILVSSSLHLAETFRIATGSVVGLVVLFAWLQSKNIIKPFFIFFALWLGLTASYGNRGNYFYPTWDTFINAQSVKEPSIFHGQKWSVHASNYYSRISDDLNVLKNSSCAIQYQINETRDALLTVISPLNPLQIAPFGVDLTVRKLRPDLDVFRQSISLEKIIILQSMDKSKNQNTNAPEGMKLYAHYTIPVQYFMPLHQELVIYAPLGCFN